MTDLIDRLSSESQELGVWKINPFRFAAGLMLYAHSLATAGQIAESFNLTGDEITQGALLKDVIDSKGTLADKIIYIGKFEAVAVRLADTQDTIFHSGGSVNKSAVKTALEI